MSAQNITGPTNLLIFVMAIINDYSEQKPDFAGSGLRSVWHTLINTGWLCLGQSA